jgi:hypothetical protein
MPKQTEQLSVRVKTDLLEWLDRYLEKNSYGECRAERFNTMLEEMRRLDEKGVTFVNLEALKEAEKKQREAQRQQEWGTIQSQSEICIRFPNTYKTMNSTERQLQCDRCRINQRPEFTACRQLRAEQKKSN